MNEEPNPIVVAIGIVLLGASAAFSIVATNNNWFPEADKPTYSDDTEEVAEEEVDREEIDHVEDNKAEELGLAVEFDDPAYVQLASGEVRITGNIVNYEKAPLGKISLATEAGVFQGSVDPWGDWAVSLSPENIDPEWWSITARYQGSDFSTVTNLRLGESFGDLRLDTPTTELSVSWHSGGPFEIDEGAWWGETVFPSLMRAIEPWSLGTIEGGEFDGYELAAKYQFIEGMFYGPAAIEYFLLNREEEVIVAMPKHGTNAGAFRGYANRDEALQETSSDGNYEFLTARYDLYVPALEPEETHIIPSGYVIEKKSYGIGFTNQVVGRWDSEQRKYVGQGLRVPIGETTEGKRVYMLGGHHPLMVEADSGVLHQYGYQVPFFGDYGRIPSITWSGGLPNENEYTLYRRAGCGGDMFAYREDINLDSEDFIVAGTTNGGEPIYAHANSDDPDLLRLYDQYGYTGYGSEREKLTYAEFIGLRPVVFWKEPFGIPVELRRASFQPLAECGKPVIYLYPEEEQEVDVFVNLKGPMTVSEPEHGEEGWSVLAHVDGYVTNLADGVRYPNLFWEGYGVLYETSEKGFVVAQEDLESWLDETLTEIGFTQREEDEFVEFWLPNLPESPYVFITFVDQYYFDRDAALKITPEPDTVSRVFMEYAPLSTPIEVEEQTLPKIEREGFTVVEWGGALYK